MSDSSNDTYGFDSGADIGDGAIKLPKRKKTTPVKVEPKVDEIKAIGEQHKFVSRQPSRARKPGPRRTEPQSKVSIAGPQRVLERFQVYCDEQGSIAYWQAIELLLDKAKAK